MAILIQVSNKRFPWRSIASGRSKTHSNALVLLTRVRDGRKNGERGRRRRRRRRRKKRRRRRRREGRCKAHKMQKEEEMVTMGRVGVKVREKIPRLPYPTSSLIFLLRR